MEAGSLVYYLHDQCWIECQVSSRTHDSLILTTRDNDEDNSVYKREHHRSFEYRLGDEDEGVEGNRDNQYESILIHTKLTKHIYSYW